MFIKEIVSRAAIALMARWLYNENYVTLPTGNVISRSGDTARVIDLAKYYWTFQKRSQFIELVTRGAPSLFRRGIYRAALLGLFDANGWWDGGVPRRTSALADLAGGELTP